MTSPRLTDVSFSSHERLQEPAQFYARFGFLDSDVETLWGGVGKERPRNYQGRFRTLLDNEVEAFKRVLGENNQGGIVRIEG